MLRFDLLNIYSQRMTFFDTEYPDYNYTLLSSLKSAFNFVPDGLFDIVILLGN